MLRSVRTLARTDPRNESTRRSPMTAPSLSVRWWGRWGGLGLAVGVVLPGGRGVCVSV